MRLAFDTRDGHGRVRSHVIELDPADLRDRSPEEIAQAEVDAGLGHAELMASDRSPEAQDVPEGEPVTVDPPGLVKGSVRVVESVRDL